MRTLVIGDIHGGYRALIQVLQRADVTEKDTLIFLGDYVDAWSESPELLDFLIELGQKQRCIFIRGNHDDLLLEWFGGAENKLWHENGGTSTIEAYNTVSEANKKRHIDFLEKLQNYYLDDENRLFVHAGFTHLNGVTYEYYPKMFFWERTLWESALSLNPALTPEDTLYPKRFKLYKEIYIGHTPVTRIGETTPQNRANVWNVDTGAAFKGKLTILDIATKEYWQSDSLPELYPGEIGRN